MSFDLFALSMAPAVFLAAWLGATSLMRSHQPIVGHDAHRLALWSLAGALSLFWMIVVLIVGIAL